MTERDYTPRGCTALLDAIGGAIHHIANVHKYAREEDVPEHTIFVIITDGKENASQRYTADRVKQMIEKQKKLDGRAYVSTILFDTESIVLHDRVSLHKIEPMTERDYTPRGCTALLDAIGGAIHHIANVHKYAREEDRPEHTVFVITTDGMENASHRYSSDEVKAMVRKEKEQYGWEFLFLGANIDAVETAARFGIGRDRAVNFHSDSRGQALNYKVVSEAVCQVRCNAPLGADWKGEIEADFWSR
jgi:Mg-chelatase subunit ChlD